MTKTPCDWDSTITRPEATIDKVVKFGGVYFSSGKLYWLEERPDEGGRSVLCEYAPDDPKKSKRNGIDVSPQGTNVRTRANEDYGGDAVVMRGNKIFYSEFTTQRLCKLSDDGTSKPIPGDKGGRYRYADGVLSYNCNVIYCVREDHKHSEKEVVKEIVSIDVRDGYTKVLARGNASYSHPRVSSNGKKLAYITWNHPAMPLCTELRVTDIYSAKSNESCDHKLIAGGREGDTAVIRPTYQGGRLYYISNRSGYYNIYRAGFEGSILPMEADFGQLRQQGFLFTPGKNGRLVAQYEKDGRSVLLTANVRDGRAPATDIEEYSGEKDGLPMTFTGLVAGENGNFYFAGGSPGTLSSIYEWNIESKGEATILSCSSSC